MKSTLLSSIAWLGALQSWGAPVWSLDTAARWLGIAGVMGTLTVLIYRLGVWRQELEHTKDTVAAEVKAHREESAANFDRIERRLDAIDHLLAMAAEQRARTARWKARAERRLERLEHNTATAEEGE
jgi:hypothetical protein